MKRTPTARHSRFGRSVEVVSGSVPPALLPLRNLFWSENLFIAAVALFVTGVVGNFAWLSEDCFITLRYVSNTVSGYGPVFNVGEHVQGYTHPAWFVLLLVGSLIFGNPLWVAYGLCFLFTLLTVWWVGHATLRVPQFFSRRVLVGPDLLGVGIERSVDIVSNWRSGKLARSLIDRRHRF